VDHINAAGGHAAQDFARRAAQQAGHADVRCGLHAGVRVGGIDVQDVGHLTDLDTVHGHDPLDDRHAHAELHGKAGGDQPRRATADDDQVV
jgi:hypothetical protein